MSDFAQQTTARKTPITDYNKGVFKGQQFPTKEDAINAGAKTYAKQSWNDIVRLNKLLGLDIQPCDLIAVKKEIIKESLASRTEFPSEFEV